MRVFLIPVFWLAALGACADVTDPLPPPEELVLLADSAAAGVGIYAVADPTTPSTVPLSQPGAAPGQVAPRGARAAIPLGSADVVALLDLRTREVVDFLPMPTGSGPAGAAWASDSLLLVSLPGEGTVLRVDLVQRDTLTLLTATDPRDLIVTRGRVFVLDANTAPCAGTVDRCALGPSRVITADPLLSGGDAALDTIPLPGALNAAHAVVGRDGLLYVVASGDPVNPAGRLSVIDPVRRLEVAGYGGLGNRPGAAAAAEGFVLITSRLEGLLEFDTRERRLSRPAGSGVPVLGAVAAVVDQEGRVWVAREVGCGTLPGVLTVLRPDYVTLRDVALPSCPSAGALALVPPAG